jgi:hypothetical protein
MEFPAEEITLQPGERRLAITASIKGLSVPETLIQGIWDGDSTWQLVAEPKAARFAAPAKLTLSTYNDGYLAIETSTPLVDLWLLDEGSTSTFQENFLTLPEPGIFYVRTTKSPTYLEARSLAGEHKLVVTRSPIE